MWGLTPTERRTENAPKLSKKFRRFIFFLSELRFSRVLPIPHVRDFLNPEPERNEGEQDVTKGYPSLPSIALRTGGYISGSCGCPATTPFLSFCVRPTGTPVVCVLHHHSKGQCYTRRNISRNLLSRPRRVSSPVSFSVALCPSCARECCRM